MPPSVSGGLLPPLPLSVQEAQQDKRIAIVASPEPGQQSGLERRQTAANRVKEEWEAKNRERLNEFRFGGNSPMRDEFPANGLEAVKEVDTPLPSPLPSPGAHDSPSEFGADIDAPEARAPRAPPPTLNLSRGHGLSPPLMQAWSDDTPPDPCFFPLPPSPTPGSATEANFASLISAFATTPAVDGGFTPMSPSFLPLPPSPSFSSPSVHSTLQGGTETPRVGGDAAPKPPYSPTTASMEESLLSPPSRSQSIPRMDGSESESSLGCVPSLVDSESQTSSMSTPTDSLPSASTGFGRMRNVPLATKVRNSTIESDGLGHHAISVIVESPSEERDGAVLSESPIEEDDAAAQQKAALMKPNDEAQVSAPTSVPQRRTTDPVPQAAAANVNRSKSLNIFKKMSVRRFGRAKSTVGPPAGFDSRHAAAVADGAREVREPTAEGPAGGTFAEPAAASARRKPDDA
ncbi:hypothetical protein MVEN_02127000 [Mycena venus]|uniref:Uncharacterized protein n=1 Tax=Mycena venus TaxID=2733690 RepID=A0A8H6XA75_9AGAR|nr:hypothetical protein MVEN_02127000 [Mycena venus]